MPEFEQLVPLHRSFDRLLELKLPHPGRPTGLQRLLWAARGSVGTWAYLATAIEVVGQVVGNASPGRRNPSK
jgi:hypothetical protein